MRTPPLPSSLHDTEQVLQFITAASELTAGHVSHDLPDRNERNAFRQWLRACLTTTDTGEPNTPERLAAFDLLWALDDEFEAEDVDATFPPPPSPTELLQSRLDDIIAASAALQLGEFVAALDRDEQQCMQVILEAIFAEDPESPTWDAEHAAAYEVLQSLQAKFIDTTGIHLHQTAITQ